MTPSQSLIVTDDALKLNCASVIFVDHRVQIDGTILLLQLLCAIHEVSGNLHLSKTIRLSAHKTLVYNTHVSQGSVATRLRCGEIFNNNFIENFPQSVSVKEC